ncbi:uncharacterized protein LOC129290258 [Prosopis cineraria]|uniref:uncharacterized protein LOC129290258 n=1 Tax=Prosopis cineraria TaxID=364024 RepID=UPI00240EEEBA|nr:uncharacterized protein LOC129290258 [Prosopis cineraria]
MLVTQHTGFDWDAESNTVTADEEVWKNYIVVHPEATQYKKQGLKHYNLLGVIFNRSTAMGVLHHSSTQDPPNSDDENNLENEYINTGVHIDLSRDDDVGPETIERVTHSGKRVVEVSNSKKRKEYRSSQMGDAIQA